MDTFASPVSVYAGTAGTIVCTPANQNADVKVPVLAGGYVPFRVLAVKSTGTTAVSQLATPVNAAFTQTDTGGVLPPSTTYSYRVSATDAGGESLASTATTGATSATAGNTHAMVVNWGAVSGATGYRIYGRTGGSELFIAAVGSVTTYTDTGSITPTGAAPTANTSATGLVAVY